MTDPNDFDGRMAVVRHYLSEVPGLREAIEASRGDTHAELQELRAVYRWAASFRRWAENAGVVE